ncbi:MAG: hypothetical protein KY446_00565 [Proteobacteria bacterium]|nr:hypothetical protein [Pseudomonadota bacterium]
MLRNHHRRAAVLGAVCIAAISLGSCETPTPEPAPVVVAAPPPAPLPPLTVAPRVIEQAAAFEAYMNRAAGITPSFTDGPSVARSLTIAAAYEPRQLATGAVAYGAVAALQDPVFVEAVRAYTRNPAQRADIAARIAADPAYITGFPGASSAASLVAQALDREGRRVRVAGESVKQSAYSVQRQAWSKVTIPNREERLANVKALGTALAPADTPTIERLRSLALGQTPSAATPASLRPPYTPVVVRSLAIAALSALGYGDDPAFAPSFDTLLVEPTGGSCLNMSKLNLNQCLAVAKPWYEDVFCLGQHVLIDTGQCMVEAGNAAPPAMAAAVVPVAAPTAAAAAAQARPATPKPGG